jgi:hypothetical protein
MGKKKLNGVPTSAHLTSSMLSGLDLIIRERDAMLLQMSQEIINNNKHAEVFLKQCARELGLPIETTPYTFNPSTRTFHKDEKLDG